MNLLRPLSPHLPIYKPQLTSTFSIYNRISGVFLATIVVFFYLLCLKIGLICFTYETFYQFFFYSSKLLLISVEITFLALSYHLYHGVGHLFRDFSLFFQFQFMLTSIPFPLVFFRAALLDPVPRRVASFIRSFSAGLKTKKSLSSFFG